MIANIISNKEPVKTNQDVHITNREKEIIKLIVDELSNQQIADNLFISLRTVETHRRNLMQKLKLNSAVSLVKWAVYNNVVALN